MGLLSKPKPNTNSNTNTGMGLLLVFFPEDNSSVPNKTNLLSSTSTSPSSSSSSSSSSLRRTNSNVLLSKAQSTISICALLLFITLLLFTLSTFEPTIPTTTVTPTRRFLLHKPPSPLRIPQNPTTKPKTQNWLTKLWQHNASKGEPFSSTALQRMGTLYQRGTRAMSDLVVCHVAEDTTHDELRLFLRVLHRSGLTAKSDVVFVFASASSRSRFAAIIGEENDAFLSLVELHRELNSTRWSKEPESDFDVTRFLKGGKKKVEMAEPLWGKKIRSNFSNPEAGEGELAVLSYGSVLSFDAEELDPENSLAGFLGHVPLILRRWACYPMLLGRVRRNFKHVMLVDVKSLVIFNDPLSRVRNRSAESVFLYTKHGGNKYSDRTRPVNAAIVMGGDRGIRRLSNAMLIEIVRAAMQHKKKNSVSESAILSQLVHNDFVLKNVNLITSTESIPEVSWLGSHKSAASTSLSDYPIIQRGTSNYDLNSVIKKKICSCVVDSSVYRDC